MNLDKLKKNYKVGCSKKLSAWRKKLKIFGKGCLRERMLMKSSQEFQKNYWGSTPDGIFNPNGYGICSIRVDGNDALVVFTAIQEARKKIAVNEHKTVLVEVNCTLFEIEAYASCGSVVNCFFYVQQALRKQDSRQSRILVRIRDINIKVLLWLHDSKLEHLKILVENDCRKAFVVFQSLYLEYPTSNGFVVEGVDNPNKSASIS
ncbi:hypothetical protein BC332_25295 [Capsicum chinense]|nr:hypothetical protein BC332_25295 [Capsicum chinense]